MAYALQQLINGVTLGMIYGLIAVGYTMVYGIIGMINFAHGDVFMIGAVHFADRAARVGRGRHHLRADRAGRYAALRGGAVRALRLDHRARRLPAAARLVPSGAADQRDRHVDHPAELRPARAGRPAEADAAADPRRHRDACTQNGFAVQLSWMQIAIVVITLAVLAVFTWLVARTPLGRAMRACEQDLKMAGLLGIDTDRTISLTFVIGAALAAVAGLLFLLYYGSIDFFIGFVAGVKAFTAAVLGGIGIAAGRGARRAADRADRGVLVGLFQRPVQGRRRVLDARHRADVHADRHARPRRRGEGMSTATAVEAAPRATLAAAPPRSERGALRDAFLSALVALGLFGPMVGLRTVDTGHGLVLRATPGAARRRRRGRVRRPARLLAWRAARRPVVRRRLRHGSPKR